MGLRTKIVVNSLVACVAASVFCAPSQAKSGDGQVAQDAPKTPMKPDAPAGSGTDVAEDSNPKSSRLSTLATATTFEAIGVTPEFYCERRDPSNCYVELFPPTNEIDEMEIAAPSNPHRMVRQDSAFESAIAYTGSILFPADLDPQFIAYYVPSFTLSDDIDEADLPASLWWETALLPVIWSQTGCSGVMGIGLRRGVTEHPIDSFFFEDGSSGIAIQTFSAFQKMSVELTVSGYQIRTQYGETASITLTPDDEGRCVAVVQRD